MHCGYYKAVGHNRSGCSQLKATVLREVVEEEEEQVQNEQSAAEQPIVRGQSNLMKGAQLQINLLTHNLELRVPGVGRESQLIK